MPQVDLEKVVNVIRAQFQQLCIDEEASHSVCIIERFQNMINDITKLASPTPENLDDKLKQ